MRLLNSAFGDVLSLAFSPGGDALAAAVEDQGVFLWNLHANGNSVRLDTGVTDRARTLFFSDDGRAVWWGTKEGLKRYDRDDREAAEKPLAAHGMLLRFARTPDGARMASEHNFPHRTLTGWSDGAAGWEQDWSVTTHDVSVRALAIDPAGARVGMVCQSAGKAGKWWEEHPTRVELRSAVSGVVQGHGPCPHHEVAELAFSPDGTQLVAVEKMNLIVWAVPEVGTYKVVRNDSRKHFTAACYHPSGRHLLVTSNDESVHVFDTASWERAARFHWRAGRLRAVAVSPDGTLAAAGTDAGGVVVWDLDV
ncbi:MAG: WD40 repeat domain-containing protein [Gemmataceae bacterium]|nr:WD40 repeat domain-containing protein [Gemmataceae bacterium]